MLRGLRSAVLMQVTAVRMQADDHSAGPPRDQRTLFGSRHPHRDIDVPAQQVFSPIGQREFDDDFGMPISEFGQDRRQDLRSDDFGGGNSHNGLRFRLPARSRPDQGGSRAGHGLRVNSKSMGGSRGP